MDNIGCFLVGCVVGFILALGWAAISHGLDQQYTVPDGSSPADTEYL